MKTTPFLLQANLDSPVIVSQEAFLTLDSILSAACLLNGEDDSVLPLAKTDDIYHGSAAFLVGPPCTSDAPFISRTTIKDLSNPRILPNTKKKGVVVKIDRFPDNARLDHYISYHVPKVAWLGLGDPYATLEIVSRLSGIGKRSNSGYGQVSSFSVTPIHTDYSMRLPNGSPARPIPVSICHKLNIDAFNYPVDRATCKPNYFDDANAQMCVTPESRLISDAHLLALTSPREFAA